MRILQPLLESIYSPTFYQQIPHKPLTKALKYFFLLILFLTIIRIIFLLNLFLIVIPLKVNNIVRTSVNYFPDNLEIKIKNGQAFTNVKQPYFIKIPEIKNNKEDLLVIDTKTPFSATQFNKFHSIMWLGKDTLFYRRNSSEINSFDLSKINNFTLNKLHLFALIERVTPYIKFIGPLLLVFTFLGIYASFSLRLIYLIFLAFLIWIVAKIFNQSLSYAQSYKVGIYGMTLGFLIEAIFSVFFLNSFPFMFTLVTLIIISLNFLHAF